MRSTIHLGASGEQARIIPDEHDDGWVLEIGGAIQSHVDLEDPSRIRYEYLRRMANVLDAAWAPGRPVRVLHLGAGALTLPRYLQATRPGSAQTVVDLDRELPSFVLGALPLPEGTDLTVLIGDARAVTADLAAGLATSLDTGPATGLAAGGGPRFDAVVLDIDTGAGPAAHLTGAEFYAELLDVVAADGVLLVNIGDDAGLHFLAQQASAAESACAEAGLSGVWALADATLLDRAQAGNVVLAAGGALAGSDPEDLRAALAAAGPHPATVLDPGGTAALVATLTRGAR